MNVLREGGKSRSDGGFGRYRGRGVAPLRRYDWPPRSVYARAGQMGAAGSAHSAFVPNLSMAVTLLGFGAPASFGRYEVGTWEK